MITPRRRQRDTFLPWIYILVDFLSTFFMLKAVFWFRFSSGFFESPLGETDYPVYFKVFSIVPFIVIFFMRFYGLYRPSRLYSFGTEIGSVCKAVTASTVIVMALTFFVRSFTFSRTFVVLAGIAVAASVSLGRYLFGLIVMEIDKKRGSQRNILIIGCDENARKLARFYRRNPRFSTRVEGYLDDSLRSGERVEDVPVLGPTALFPEIIRKRREIHEVVLALQGQPEEKVLKMVYECEKGLVSFRWIADIFGLIASRMSVSYFGGVPVLSFADSPLADWENRVLKRTVDILVSSAALVLFLPLFLVLAIAVKCDSKGPVFYRQQRIGEDGKRFRLVKFRTMQTGAETATGPVWAKENDERRTKLGIILRRNNLDELPQFWNVFVGDMSLVGPRPERPFFVSQFKEDVPRYMARHAIRSGITGWAQVNGLRGNTSIEERTKYDLYYIENWSLWLDFKILCRTVFQTFSKTQPNAY